MNLLRSGSSRALQLLLGSPGFHNSFWVSRDQNCSRQINKHLFVLRITLHIASLNQNFDLLLDHSRLSFKHLDHWHIFSDQFLVSNRLSSLQDFHRSCLNDNLSFGLNLFCLSLIFLIRCCSLFLSWSDWNQVDSNIIARELHIQFNLFVGVIKSRFLYSLV